MNSVSSGVISSTEQNKPAGTRGIITHVQQITGTVEIFDGTADTDTKLIHLIDGSTETYAPCVPVQFTK